jgi:hypothetical protein
VTYSAPIRTLTACEGRYPTEAEEATVLGWAASLPKRLQAANLLAKHEGEIVREAIEEIKPLYPRFGPQHDRCYEKGARDIQLLLRYVAQATICDDADMPQEKLYVWYGTIIRALGFTPGITRDFCRFTMDAAERHLPEEAFATAAPYLQRMVDDVPAFPEPMKPAVN